MNKMIKFFVMAAVLMSFIGCIKARPIPYKDIRVGMTKTEIVKLVGATNEKRYISKTNNQIQGPEKEFWHEIPMGAKLEVWTYHTAQGQLKLYFIGKSSELKFKILLK